MSGLKARSSLRSTSIHRIALQIWVKGRLLRKQFFAQSRRSRPIAAKALRDEAQRLAQVEPQRQAARPGPKVLSTLSSARPWRPSVAANLARTLGLTTCSEFAHDGWYCCSAPCNLAAQLPSLPLQAQLLRRHRQQALSKHRRLKPCWVPAWLRASRSRPLTPSKLAAWIFKAEPWFCSPSLLKGFPRSPAFCALAVMQFLTMLRSST